ncbi:vegetative cell wall protein gp1 [Triticum aestivum]|uniref:vegetative cell wall protein gp1 n=1 Tax=Triticum aestivum TaxID=4565 RepID=UPI001D029916|nr:vegetative cell wall protein gp1-like [Triticum aestivum]
MAWSALCSQHAQQTLAPAASTAFGLPRSSPGCGSPGRPVRCSTNRCSTTRAVATSTVNAMAPSALLRCSASISRHHQPATPERFHRRLPAHRPRVRLPVAALPLLRVRASPAAAATPSAAGFSSEPPLSSDSAATRPRQRPPTRPRRLAPASRPCAPLPPAPHPHPPSAIPGVRLLREHRPGPTLSRPWPAPSRRLHRASRRPRQQRRVRPPAPPCRLRARALAGSWVGRLVPPRDRLPPPPRARPGPAPGHPCLPPARAAVAAELPPDRLRAPTPGQLRVADRPPSRLRPRLAPGRAGPPLTEASSGLSSALPRAPSPVSSQPGLPGYARDGSPLDPARRLCLRRLLPHPRPPAPRDPAARPFRATRRRPASSVASRAGWLTPAGPARLPGRPAPSPVRRPGRLPAPPASRLAG